MTTLPAIPLKKYETLETLIWFWNHMEREGFRLITYEDERNEERYIKGCDPY